jgi:S1-C subfamily serine protease
MRALIAGVLSGLALLPSGPVRADAQGLDEVFRQINPAVVVIRARGQEVQSGRTVSFTETGAGVIVSARGKVVTAAHVVQGMDSITVEVLGDDPVPARVILIEPKADLALIQVEGMSRDAGVARLADSDQVRAGQQVIIVGAPYGLRHSLSTGVISARWAPGAVNADFPLSEFFQTDAAINTGNSGGPMFDREGNLIGIVSHIISKSGGNEGLGFVVSSNTVKRLLLDRSVLWAGVDGRLLSDQAARAFKLPQPAGYLVTFVTPGSDAAALGLRGGTRREMIGDEDLMIGGDIVLTAQGIPVTAASDVVKVRQALSKTEPGQEISLTVLRAGRVTELKGRRPK